MSTSFKGQTRFFPSDKSRVRGGKKKNSSRATRLNQQVDIETSCLQSSCPLPRGQHAGGLFHVFVTATLLHLTVLGCVVLFISQAGLPRYSRFAAALFSLPTDWCNPRIARGDTEGTNSSNSLCLMFVYVLFYVNLCKGLIFFFFFCFFVYG